MLCSPRRLRLRWPARLTLRSFCSVHHLGDEDLALSPPGAHTPRLFQSLQKAGVREPARALTCLGDDTSEVVDVDVALGGRRWRVRVTKCAPESKRLNESWGEAALRQAKHAAAHRLRLDETFQAALRGAEEELKAAKQAKVEEARAATRLLPTMTDAVLERFVASSRFRVRSEELSLESLGRVPAAAAIGVDTEGFDVERDDWRRPWLVQLAFQHERKIGAQPLDMEGEVLVLLALDDAAMRAFAAWMVSAAALGSRFYFFDGRHDLDAVFGEGQVPEAVQDQSFDLKKFGTSLHALAGQELFDSELRKHERLCKSLCFLPDTKGVTEAQVHYAAADAIATLVLGERLLQPTGAASE